MVTDHQSEILFERWKYEDETLAQRTDWFLIFHAILLEAFFAASTPVRQLPIALFGIFAGFLWFWIGVRQRWDHQHLGRVVESEELVNPGVAQAFRGLYEVRRTLQPWWMKWARATPAFAIIIPAAVMVVWICYLGIVADSAPGFFEAVTLRRLIWTGGFVVGIVVSAGAVLRLIADRPDFRNKDVLGPLLPKTGEGA